MINLWYIAEHGENIKNVGYKNETHDKKELKALKAAKGTPVAFLALLISFSNP